MIIESTGGVSTNENVFTNSKDHKVLLLCPMLTCWHTYFMCNPQLNLMQHVPYSVLCLYKILGEIHTDSSLSRLHTTNGVTHRTGVFSWQIMNACLTNEGINFRLIMKVQINITCSVVFVINWVPYILNATSKWIWIFWCIRLYWRLQNTNRYIYTYIYIYIYIVHCRIKETICVINYVWENYLVKGRPLPV